MSEVIHWPEQYAALIARLPEIVERSRLTVGGFSACVDVYRNDNLIERAAQMGQRLRDELTALAQRHAIVGELRGEGMFYVLELVRERATAAGLAGIASVSHETLGRLGVYLDLLGGHLDQQRKLVRQIGEAGGEVGTEAVVDEELHHVARREELIADRKLSGVARCR